MSNFDILVLVRMTFKRVMRECGSTCRALSACNLVAIENTASLGEAVALRNKALGGLYEKI